MNDQYLKEVNFKKYCETCEYKDLKEKYDPCCECLDYCMNQCTDKPVNWKEKKK